MMLMPPNLYPVATSEFYLEGWARILGWGGVGRLLLVLEAKFA